MTNEMNDLLQAVAAEWGQGSQEHNIARDVCKLANKEIEALTAENERLASVATDFASSLIVAENNLSHVSEENERLREALRVYAGPLEWTQEGGWGMFPVWADGYQGGVYIDDNTLDFGDAARAALEKQP